MSKSKIEWTDRVWNPVRGCSRVSEGCRNCYAERQAARFSKPGEPWHGFARWRSRVSGLEYENRKSAGGADPTWTGRVELVPEKLSDPLRWRKPCRIFVNSMSDLFHESLSDADITRVFNVMRQAPQHTFQILTKRAARMRDFCSRLRFDGDGEGRMWLAAADDGSGYRIMGGNGCTGMTWVWLGVSVENQATADERIPHLLATPATVRFVSAEPLLGPVDLTIDGLVCLPCEQCDDEPVCPETNVVECHKCDGTGIGAEWKIDWVIVGGESGPGARPCREDWIRSIVTQCGQASVACFVKQRGAWRPMQPGDRFDTRYGRMKRPAAFLVDDHGDVHCTPEAAGAGAVPMLHVGGKGGDPTEWPEDLRVREFPSLDSRGIA